MARSFYLTDNLQSTRALTNSSGTVTDTFTYDAFGNDIAQTGSTPNEFLYAGQQFDTAIGEYFDRARYYDQLIGRFASMDVYPGTTDDPLTLNHYAYANGDPIDQEDPSGMLTVTDTTVATKEGLTLDQKLALVILAVGGLGIATWLTLARPRPTLLFRLWPSSFE